MILVTDDLSYNKEATLSRAYVGLGNYAARFAVDRNTLTCMRAQEIGLTSPGKTVWWKVDLGGVYIIYSIAILFKNYEVVGMFLLYKQDNNYYINLKILVEGPKLDFISFSCRIQRVKNSSTFFVRKHSSCQDFHINQKFDFR